MLHGYPGTHRQIMKVFFAIAIAMSVVSCGVVTPKNYPPNKPFVYKTNVNLEGKFKRDEKNDIRSRLEGQLDDSIRIRTVQKFIFWHVLKNPPAYDSSNADKSVIYMRALLNSLGYFRDTITYDTTLQIVNDQYRTSVNFNVIPGKVTRLDSLSWNINHPELKSLTDSAINETFLKKGEPFAQPIISAELNRLVDLYRNNGYLRFSRDEMIGVWDTVDASLLRPTLDPLEQIQQLQELQKRRENPTADLEIRLKPNLDSSKLVKFYVGRVTVYPDFNRDTILYSKNEKLVDSLRVIYYRNYFKPRLLPENISFKYGDVYSQRNYIGTINRFNSLGAWRLVSIEQFPRINSDTVDFVIRLTPADKYSFSANVEGSFNTGTFFAGNLFGVGLNFGLQNRNFAKGSNQANTNFRFGTELNVSQGENFVQTKSVSFGHTIYFPRIIPRFKFLSEKFKEDFRTIFSFNVANTDRIDLFDLTTFNLSWGYEKAWKNKLVRLSIPNVEYAFLSERDSLIKLIDNNPSLGFIFNKGLVVSFVPSFTITWPKKNIVTSLRLNLEHSGLLAGLIRTPFFDSNLYRFVKIDVDLRKNIKINHTEFAFRFFAGTGYCFFDSSRNPTKNQSLPFFKQYFGGGPNSMRGWALRRLGPGSTVKPFKDDPLRFGDIQLELNGEFRFYLMDIAGVKFHSALYTDIGNVWFLRKFTGYPDGTFYFKNLLKELAVDVGTGLRIDFSYFILRLDYAFKVRDPSPEPVNILSQYKWFYGWSLKTLIQGQLQLGINYPF